MADDAKTLQEKQLELLRRRIAENGLAATAPAQPRQLVPGERYPLSSGQLRMWFLQAMDPAETALNIGVAYRLAGAVDEARLRAAVSNVVARHAILRTTYGVDADGEPYQTFADHVETPWQVRDWTGRAGTDLVEAARREFARPFDLANELPLRITLGRLAEREFALVLVVHHICWDDDSWAVFLHELGVAYEDRRLALPATQFVAVEVLGNSAAPSDDDLDYWRKTLRPLPEPLELPGTASSPPAAQPSKRAASRTRMLPVELFTRVEDFGRNHSATPFMVLLAAFGALVRRYTGASDFVVSVPVTERSAAAEQAIGYFGNTLLLRIAPEPSDTFASLVGAVRETCLSGFAHQSVGIEQLVRELNPERTFGGGGTDQLVRLGFSLRKSADALALDGIAVRQLQVPAVTTQVPLAVAVVLDTGGVYVEFEYQTDVLAAELVERMQDHYLRLLDNALCEPDRRLASLQFFGSDELAAILTQSRGERVDPPASTMVALLEAAATAAPTAVALISDDAELTYEQLHSRANRLARWLVAQGIGADDVIGLRMTTSVEFMVAVLATLKAGAAYLPIDPANPADRIEYFVSDAAPRLVFGREEFDAAERAAAPMPDSDLTDAERLHPLHPEHLAYVIYTSGSTGLPKGVAVSHRALAEHLYSFFTEWTLTPEDIALQWISVSFDASLAEIFGALAFGAKLVVPKPDAFGDMAYVAELMNRHHITVLQMVPSMLNVLLLLPEPAQWNSLRHMAVGGEPLSGEVADTFTRHFDAELRNHYGPTEAVVCATHMPVDGPQGVGVVPIGVPNRNVFAYVLDMDLQLVPAGVIGELYLGGVQLARGYLNQPVLTAERFVADPFNPGTRMYRTGDLVRRNSSGVLEFLGRADEQVKIRGYRIEPGEIESVIAGHPAVRHCLVVVEDTVAGRTLVAYVVPAAAAEEPARTHADVDLGEIRAFAASALPEYMVPSAFGVITDIPLTNSGKLDKRALPAPMPIAASSYRAPATPTERRVCAIFARLFDCERVGAQDSFFQLGGHSLLAARLVAQIRAEFGIELSVRAVFDSPTPAGLAERLVAQFLADYDIDLDELDDDDIAAEPRSQRPALVECARPERLPLSYSQLAMWFQYRMEGPSAGVNIAIGLRIEGPLDAAALNAALNDVVRRHESLRMHIREHQGMPYQSASPTRELQLPVTTVDSTGVDGAVTELCRYAFKLESEPLIRATLLAQDPNRHVLLLLAHHIIIDHASLRIVLHDLTVAYRARLKSTAPEWDRLPIDYADYVLWQHRAFDASSEWGHAELAYWREALAGLPEETSVALDHVRPPVLGRHAAVSSVLVPAARRAALAELAEHSSATEFMVYQAALAVVLHKLGGGNDIAIGTPVAARVDPGTVNVIGLLANVVVLRTDLSGTPSLRDVITRSRDVVLDAFAHQEVPIARLVEEINPPRTRSRNPLFQNMLHFHGDDWALAQRDLTEAGGTKIVPLRSEFDVSLLDLDVGINVTPDGGLEVRVVGNADLYQPTTVALIADALTAVIEAFATTPDAAVSTLELLPEAALDRLRRAPTPNVGGRSQPLTAAAAQTQQVLIEVLEELLEIGGVAATDNFFALGGDSIISIKWSARVIERGLALTPAMVFEHATIGELAAAVDAATDSPAAAADSTPERDYTPMSASGLSTDALADLTAAWENRQ
ncbi:non-ribosomal peptide synthetase [Mycobacterium sherrisii]|uniref:non-ribosomal peptide synthetase n=1 Tax=Mycobacterium sherrisii TaxID=243061 RepID=UPI000A15C838|nr:non-ribosomal peptide synthetase [Mycobacterium sherrisii]MCV7029831.1 non-ribosomal peptide synthetase [Mycobacterium sherrisii]ORW85084.1 non-ribosomal peptide synthetase [Mycobacterium sherrisii]